VKKQLAAWCSQGRIHLTAQEVWTAADEVMIVKDGERNRTVLCRLCSDDADNDDWPVVTNYSKMPKLFKNYSKVPIQNS